MSVPRPIQLCAAHTLVVYIYRVAYIYLAVYIYLLYTFILFILLDSLNFPRTARMPADAYREDAGDEDRRRFGENGDVVSAVNSVPASHVTCRRMPASVLSPRTRRRLSLV